jgi:hypothetical protein
MAHEFDLQLPVLSVAFTSSLLNANRLRTPQPIRFPLPSRTHDLAVQPAEEKLQLSAVVET